MDVWHEVKLGNVAQVRSGYAFKSADWKVIGIPVVKIANVKDGSLAMEGCALVSKAVASQAGRFNLEEGDILIALTGYIGDVALVRGRDLPAVLNQRVGMFSILHESRLDKSFLFQLLRDQGIKESIAGLGYGSAQPNVSPSLIHNIIIPLPPLPEQRAIAHMLGTLDDKIELNRRMCETLETMARALFQSWFVDFEPVRAKMEGRWRPGESLPGLPAEHYHLFPDTLVPSALGDIPEGWEVRTLGERFRLTMGQSPPGTTYNNDGEGLPFFQGRTDFGLRYPSNRVFCSAPSRLAQSDDTLVSVRAPVGDVNMAWEESCIGRGVAAIRHLSGSRSFSYYALQTLRAELQQYEQAGTVFGAITGKQFGSMQVVEPPPEVVNCYEILVLPWDDNIRRNVAESRGLTVQRDVLLPRLVSGELRVESSS